MATFSVPFKPGLLKLFAVNQLAGTQFQVHIVKD
jgi:hypothetical protein